MNPFAALAVSDDEQTHVVKQHVKKSHQERKQIKEQKIKEAETGVVNQDLPERVKENNKKSFNRNTVSKTVTAGHTSDKKSGTGRQDRPRKQGGGRGNIGNLKDQLKKEKYVAQGEVVAEEPQVVEQFKGISLEDYYKNKGVESVQIQNPEKEVAKKEIKAEWVAKEKLTVLQTKQDKKAAEKTTVKPSKRNFTDKIGNDNIDTSLFGFDSAEAKAVEVKVVERQFKPRQQRQFKPRNNNNGDFKKGPKGNFKKGDKPQHKGQKKTAPVVNVVQKKPTQKVNIKIDDFPAL